MDNHEPSLRIEEGATTRVLTRRIKLSEVGDYLIGRRYSLNSYANMRSS